MANILSTGSSALIAFQRALATVSHNVANLKTPGYSRQQADFETRAPIFTGAGYIGTGTQISDIRRVSDDLANARLIDSSGELARLQQIASLSDRVDGLMSDKATGVTGLWSNFFDSVSALSSNASGAAQRQSLLGDAQAMTSRFQQMQGQFDQLASEVNSGLSAGAGEVNRLSQEIAQLNNQLGNVRNPSPDLLDRRDQLITELVGWTGGSAIQQDGGAINVVSAGGQPLVVGSQASKLTTIADPFQPERRQLALQTPGQTIRIDERAMGGRIGGLLEFRSQVLDPTSAELGRIALGLATDFNANHAKGVDQYGALGADFFNVPAPVVAPHSANSGTAQISASIADLASVDGRNVVVQWRDGAWSATDAATGSSVPMQGTGTGADPLRVGGMALVMSGTPQAQDRFLLQPTAHVARGLEVAITDPSRIAAATPVRVEASLGNLGSARPSAVRVDQAGNANLLTPVTLDFLDADHYTLDGDGPFPYTAGARIDANGWSFTLDGVPAAGDRFEVKPTGAGSSDNGNAALLAGLDDVATLAGGSLSLNGALAGLTTSVGSAARHAGYAAEAQAVLHGNAEVARASISGVNIDEEAANMMQLQQAYQAAAQIISTADTLFQSVLAAVRR